MVDLPTATEPASSSGGLVVSVPLGSRLADAERRLIYATLDHCGGNRTRTAEVLGVCLKTLYNRLNEYQAQEGRQAARSVSAM